MTALGGGAAQSWVLANRSGRMIDNDYPLGFKVALHRKDLAIALERAVLGRDSRVKGVRAAVYADSAGEGAVASSTGVRVYGRATSCWLSVAALADDGTETKIGGGIDVGREPGELDVEVAASDAVAKAVRLLREVFETDCAVHFVFNGTAANSLAVAAMCASASPAPAWTKIWPPGPKCFRPGTGCGRRTSADLPHSG